jgi:hypothetical protein
MDNINTYFRKLSKVCKAIIQSQAFVNYANKLVCKEGDKEARFSLETNAFRETLEGVCIAKFIALSHIHSHLLAVFGNH